MRHKRITAYEAPKRYGIPRNEKGEQSLLLHNPGRRVFTDIEKEIMCTHLIALAAYGFPVNKVELRIIK